MNQEYQDKISVILDDLAPVFNQNQRLAQIILSETKKYPDAQLDLVKEIVPRLIQSKPTDADSNFSEVEWIVDLSQKGVIKAWVQEILSQQISDRIQDSDRQLDTNSSSQIEDDMNIWSRRLSVLFLFITFLGLSLAVILLNRPGGDSGEGIRELADPVTDSRNTDTLLASELCGPNPTYWPEYEKQALFDQSSSLDRLIEDKKYNSCRERIDKQRSKLAIDFASSGNDIDRGVEEICKISEKSKAVEKGRLYLERWLNDKKSGNSSKAIQALEAARPDCPAGNDFNLDEYKDK